MGTQYLRVTVRKILQHQLYSLISIASLAVGMATCILVFGFISYERSFDGMHPDGERTYRLNWSVPATGSRFATFYNPMSPILAEALPEIEAFTRLLVAGERQMTVDGITQQLTLTLVDDDFFRLFDYPVLQSNPDAEIRDLRAIVLTEAAALTLFGRPDPLGETVTVDGAFDFLVKAVVANNPANSHLGGNIFVNIENVPELTGIADFWTRAGYIGSDVMYHYVRLAAGAEPEAMKAVIEDYIRRNLVPDYNQEVHLQALGDIHFNPDLQNEMPMVDDILGIVKPLRKQTDILLFSSIALLTLAISALNFMNMQAVQFTKHLKEIGVRRISGSSYTELTLQLLTESGLMALFAMLLSLPLIELVTPWFHAMLGLPAQQGSFLTLPTVLALTLLAVVFGVVIGVYPALSAARTSPVAALRGELIKGKSAAVVRGILIVVQFTISIGLIIGSVTVKNQIDFALSKSLGFDPTNVVRIDLPTAEARSAYAAMKSELLGLAGVSTVSAGTTIPTRSLSDGFGFVPEDGDVNNMLVTRGISVSDDYFAALGMDIVAGRALDEQFATDMKPPLTQDRPMAVGGLILNEAAARLAGWADPADAIGAHYYQTYQVVEGATWLNDYTVVGVVADAHYGSIRREVEPVAYVFPQNLDPTVMLVLLSTANQNAALAAIDRIWRTHVPSLPIQRSFLADDYQGLYAGEARTFALFIALSSLAVLIACSGLYGLASYVAERRTREIGVRKVMGGSVWSIVLLLTNDFSKLVLVSNVIAWPLAYVAMSRWLENFAYRIDLTPLVFIGSGLIALCIAWVTVGGTAAKAASQKPVLALRYE